MADIIDSMGRALAVGDVINAPGVQAHIKWTIQSLETATPLPSPQEPNPLPRMKLTATANLTLVITADQKCDLIRYETAEGVTRLNEEESRSKLGLIKPN